ncbi:neutral zinc metallopeptidase [Nocardioides sp. zg-1228]|uniref:KPN_02809 family neutral zinc metallopeptidase n=1 Tax=Nocardioides sp. zg-1228 TaxID=2763008 RepID=UPI001642B697|nr:neutral zinc metallopeptidase [Nocardioides sp. zg-1228]MBC2934977.1 neutral zinc metallopeptidase [Nocardioides sp. zg-1228]QSF56152.1 neutral zinc metallopeptidase [Nocardioides sp. zg-1228]
MRFNPKADISRGRVSDAGRGGGRGGAAGGGMRMPLPGGARAGGGIGGILIVVLFVVLTQCTGLMSDGGGGTGSQGQAQPEGIDTGDERYANCRTGADANEDPDCARVAVTLSLESYWADTLPEQAGTELSPAAINTFSGAVSTGCGEASSQVGPFYCPPDQQIYLDTTFFDDVLQGQLGGQGGDFVEPYVLGHEYGHHIQNLMGTMGKVRTQKGPDSDAVRLELQADCYAGMWTRDASDGDGILTDLDQGDIEEALDSAKAVGDDRIQQKSGQGVDPEGWTHGSAAQRMAWFTRGYEEGTLEACDTFSASRL